MKDLQFRKILEVARKIPHSSLHFISDAMDQQTGYEQIEAILRSHLKSDPLLQEIIEVLGGMESKEDEEFVILYTAVRYRLSTEQIDIRPVCTLDESVEAEVSNTRDETIRLIHNAKKSIYIMGYWLTKGASDLIRELESAVRRNIKVIILADSEVMFVKPFRELWDKSLPNPSIYLYLGRESDDGKGPKMHAKTIVIDDEQMLITSANLTYFAVSKNIEVGVVIKCRDAVSQIAKVINSLIHTKTLFKKVE